MENNNENPPVYVPPKSNSRLIKIIPIFIGILILLIVGFYALNTYIRHQELNGENNNGAICPQDVKVCPDGSTVSRRGPACEFAECPGS